MNAKASSLDLPPSYKENQGPPEDDCRLPGYNITEESGQPLTYSKTDFSGLPLREFPSRMRARGEISRGKTFLLSDISSGEDLFCLEVHTGYSGSAPLGTRPGIILHDGLYKKDPIIAAAGDENPLGVIIPQLSRSTLVYIPPLEPGVNYSSFDRERMLAESSPPGELTYAFSFEAGEKSQRHNFEWRKFRDTGLGGFKLVRIDLNNQQLESSGPSVPLPTIDLATKPLDNKEEHIAQLNWRRFWAGLTLDGYFELELCNEAIGSGMIAQRLKVMIIVTAARLWGLRNKGRNTNTYSKTTDLVRKNRSGD